MVVNTLTDPLVVEVPEIDVWIGLLIALGMLWLLTLIARVHR